MKKIKTKFKDLFVVNTRVFKDKRGWLKEEFKKKIINLKFTLNLSNNIQDAIKSNAKSENSITLIVGSLYLIGEVLNLN